MKKYAFRISFVLETENATEVTELEALSQLADMIGADYPDAQGVTIASVPPLVDLFNR